MAAAAGSASSVLRPALRGAFSGLALGGFLYLVGDTASDYVTYRALRNAALTLVADDQELQALVGQPYAPGPWYNATLGFSHRDRVAHATFQLQGSRRVTDVAVKAGRAEQAGPASLLLYNLVGPATWRLLSCQAMVPAEGGLVAPRSLLPEHREAAAAAAAAAAAGARAAGRTGLSAAAGAAGCPPHQPQQQQKQQQQQAGQQAGPRWWARLWPRRQQQGGSSSSPGSAAATKGGGTS